MRAGYAKHGSAEKALKHFYQMQKEGLEPDKATLLSILKACAILRASEEGNKIHSLISSSNQFRSDVSLCNTLVDMYAKCQNLEQAREVFERMPERNVVSWTVMIAGYAQNGYSDKALQLFWKMKQQDVKPNRVTFLSIVDACARLGSLEEGKQIHSCIVKSGFDSDAFVESALVNMYAKCGSIGDAQQVFDEMSERDVVSWNVMITGYCQLGYPKAALMLFEQMQHQQMQPDAFTFVSALNACATLVALEKGKKIHAQLIKSDLESNIYVGNSLIHMYAACGDMKHACMVFEKMLKRDQVSFTAMMTGYVHHGYNEAAFKLFWKMKHEGLEPDRVAVLTGLNACANLAALEGGKQIHYYIVRTGLLSNVQVGNALVDMYAKCGNLVLANKIFRDMPKRDVISWTTMISGYCQHGHAKEALQLVEEMVEEGLKLDDVIFISILSACSYTGLVDEGYRYFESMIQDHKLIPAADHYTCMVDLLSRAGLLEEAKDLVSRIPFQLPSMVWVALLGACKIHGNMELASLISECLLKTGFQDASALLLISNICATTGRWKDKATLMKRIQDDHVHLNQNKDEW